MFCETWQAWNSTITRSLVPMRYLAGANFCASHSFYSKLESKPFWNRIRLFITKLFFQLFLSPTPVKGLKIWRVHVVSLNIFKELVLLLLKTQKFVRAGTPSSNCQVDWNFGRTIVGCEKILIKFHKSFRTIVYRYYAVQASWMQVSHQGMKFGTEFLMKSRAVESIRGPSEQ